MLKLILVAGATSLVSLAAGFAVGYKLAIHRLNDVYNEQMEAEIDRTRAYYERNTKPFPSPTEAVKVLAPEAVAEAKAAAAKVAVEMPEGEVPVEVLKQVVDRLKYNKISPAQPIIQQPVVEVQEEIVRNVFRGDVVSPEDDPQYQEMIDNRAGETIYLVTTEEHMENPHEFQGITLTWYEGDQVLVDEQEQPIQKLEKAIGDKDNLQFGRWSGDANVVYIRNEILGAEIEILRSTGSYAHEVLGLEQVQES